MLDPRRIMEHCDALARHSELPGGLTRVFLCSEQRATNELVLGWMRQAGMSAQLDGIGNVSGRYEGAQPGLPCLMLGSHPDTVRDAGKYDGMLGVVTAINGFSRLRVTLAGLAGHAGTVPMTLRRLPSGAGHDGMAMIELADIGMLFLRCAKGISHNPAEAISAEDAATGARVFLRFIENFRMQAR